MALFLIFLFHHTADSTPHFPVPFHPDHWVHLVSVRGKLSTVNVPDLLPAIHALLLSLLIHLSHEAALSDKKDLLTLFLLCYHLCDDSENTTSMTAIPPNISAIQWCIRATAVREICERAKEYGDNTFQ